jgi:hypothetical protein
MMRPPTQGVGKGRRKSVLPEALGERHGTHNAYDHRTESLSYDETTVEFSTTPDAKHKVAASRSESEIGRRLRRYALVLSRYGLPKTTTLAKRWKVRKSSLDAAIRVVANGVFRKVYADDPTTDTLQVSNLVAMVNAGAFSPDLAARIFSLAHTEAFSTVLAGITDTDILALFASRGDRIRDCVDIDNPSTWSHVSRYERVNSKRDWERRDGLRRYRDLARLIERDSDELSSKSGRKARQGQPKRSNEYTHKPATGIPDMGLSEGWFPLYVAKPPRDVTHRGRMGRRTVRVAEGKHPRYVERMVTDPERRMFTRKSRSLGAVIVVDCSGSMAWNDADLAEVIDLTAGATVLCYSSGYTVDADHPNAWIVAKNNARVRHLPDFPGGNGCDGPALAYAVRVLRQGSAHPVVWVSDQRVTGKADAYSPALRKETDALVRRYGIHVVENTRQAKRILAHLQGKA